jgi:hypothetical protein
MKNIYKMLYTIDNLNKQEEDFIEIDSLLEERENNDIKRIFDLIEIEPDKKVIDRILAFAFNK